jgi:hypothetical protein
MRIRIQDIDTGIKKLENNAENNIFLIQNWDLQYVIPILISRPPYRRTLQPSKENIQHFKTLNYFSFVGYFCPPGSGYSRPK